MIPAEAFRADPAFEAASIHVTDWPLCQVRLQNDGRFCWLILLPRVEGAVELSDLDAVQRAWLMEEAVQAGDMIAEMAAAEGARVDKINTAALGNVTAQLHVHVVGRYRHDPLWPDPVWGRPGTVACEPPVLEKRIETVKSHQLTA